MLMIGYKFFYEEYMLVIYSNVAFVCFLAGIH
jgi:hypothetical protein